MTRNDFELIARAVRASDNADTPRKTDYAAGVRDGRRAVIRELAKGIAATNARFDVARFLTACGVAS